MPSRVSEGFARAERRTCQKSQAADVSAKNHRNLVVKTQAEAFPSAGRAKILLLEEKTLQKEDASSKLIL